MISPASDSTNAGPSSNGGLEMGSADVVFGRIAPLQAVCCRDDEPAMAMLNDKASTVADADHCRLKIFQY
jgi:hypothetical protein